MLKKRVPASVTALAGSSGSKEFISLVLQSFLAPKCPGSKTDQAFALS